MDKFLNWCSSNTAWAKCTRTIAQGIVSVLVVYCADIFASFNLDASVCAILTALFMAILSPLQHYLGKADDEEESE
jgi:multisubunit Na+/H+ antiporter MnhG subunit